MKLLLIRSIVIAAILAPVLSVALHFPVRAFKIDPPLDPAKAETMSLAEKDAYIQSHTVWISKTEWLKNSLGRSLFWKRTLQRSIFPFVVLFGACFALGYWQQRRSC